MENIDASGNWIKDFQYVIDDEVQFYKGGTSAGNVLGNWRKARDENPGAFDSVRVWGQPAAWTDEIICSFLSDYVQELFPSGVIQILDCLGSQWSEMTLSKVWANQQLQVPIAPNATSCLQVADTHIHSVLKAYLRQAKAELQAYWDQQAALEGVQPSTAWGPFESLHVVCQGYQKLQELQTRTDLVLKGFIQNQLLVYRPNAQNELVRVDSLWPDFAQAHPRTPPGRRIPFTLAQWRIAVHHTWEDGMPPEPDWSSLDTMGNYLHQTYDKEEKPDEAVELDCRFAGLELNQDQIDMIKPAEQREPPGPPVPAHIARRVSHVMATESARRKRKVKSRWAATLASRKSAKHALKWTAQVKAAGGTIQFVKDKMPKAVQHRSRQSFLQKAKQHAKATADGKSTSKTASGGASGPQSTKAWCGNVEWAKVPGHQLMDKVVRVVGGGSAPEYLGKCGKVILVQSRKCINTGIQAYQVSVALTETKTLHLEASDVQELDPEAHIVQMKPFKQNYQGFDKALPGVRKLLGLGPEAETLEPGVFGHVLESGFVALGQIELQRCRREHRGDPVRLRGQDFLTMEAAAFLYRLCYANDHFDVETCLRGESPHSREWGGWGEARLR